MRERQASRLLFGLSIVLGLQLSLAACAGGARLVGVMGASVNQDGQPVLLVAACEGSLETVKVFAEPGSGAVPREAVGTWVRDVGAGELAELPFTSLAPAGWTGQGPSAGQFQELLRATGTGPDGASSRAVTFSMRQLQDLGAGMVLTGSGPLPREDFPARACSLLED